MSVFRLFPARTQQSKRWDVHGRGRRRSAFGPVSCSRGGFEADPYSYTGLCGCGNKSPGAGTAPAGSTESEITTVTALPDTAACLGWRSSGEARLLLHVCAPTRAWLCLSARPRGLLERGAWLSTAAAGQGFAMGVVQWPGAGSASALTQPRHF